MVVNQPNLGRQDPIHLELGKIVPTAFVGAVAILGYSYVHHLFRAAGLSPLLLDDSVFDMVFRGVILMALPIALARTLIIVAAFALLLILGAVSSILIVRASAFIAAFATLFWGGVMVGREQAIRQLSQYSESDSGTVVQCDFVQLPDTPLTREKAKMMAGLSDRGELRLLTRTSTTVYFMRRKVNGPINAVQAYAVPSGNVGVCRFDTRVGTVARAS